MLFVNDELFQTAQLGVLQVNPKAGRRTSEMFHR